MLLDTRVSNSWIRQSHARGEQKFDDKLYRQTIFVDDARWFTFLQNHMSSNVRETIMHTRSFKWFNHSPSARLRQPCWKSRCCAKSFTIPTMIMEQYQEVTLVGDIMSAMDRFFLATISMNMSIFTSDMPKHWQKPAEWGLMSRSAKYTRQRV